MSDSDESATVAESNGVTVHMTNGTEFNVEHVIRHAERDWVYANRFDDNNNGNHDCNHLVISSENIAAIDSRHIKRTPVPEIRIHHSGAGSDYGYELAELAFELTDTE